MSIAWLKMQSIFWGLNNISVPVVLFSSKNKKETYHVNSEDDCEECKGKAKLHARNKSNDREEYDKRKASEDISHAHERDAVT